MRPFLYQRAPIADAAQCAVGGRRAARACAAQYLAGGTTLLDLMKLDVMRPERADRHQRHRPRRRPHRAAPGRALSWRLATMAEAADHPDVRRDYPVVAQSLDLAASPQIRNMATLGGNVLQRTRCSYFRDPSWTRLQQARPRQRLRRARRSQPQARRARHQRPVHRHLSRRFRAGADRAGRRGGDRRRPRRQRVIPFAELHREPGDTPQIETTLMPGELIIGFTLPAAPWTRRSLYLKIRDRESYEFALASAAVALDLSNGVVNEARIALGGVATKPWRAREAEAALHRQSARRSRRPERRRRRLRRGTDPRRQRLQDRARQADARPRPAASLSR